MYTVGASVAVMVIAMGVVFLEAHNPDIWMESMKQVKDLFFPSKDEKKKEEEQVPFRRAPVVNFEKSGFIFFHVGTNTVLLEGFCIYQIDP